MGATVGATDVVFTGVAGQVFWFVADSAAAGVQSPFVISLTCAQP